MRILHINTRALEGGAARACRRLHDALQAAGHESRILSAEHVPEREDMRTWHPPAALGTPLHRLNWAVEMRTGLEGFLNVASRLAWREHAEWADVINLHNLHSFYFALPLLARMARRAPLVWTLHDMWPLTGHCAYPMECPRWLAGCGHCPNLHRPARICIDTSGLLYRLRRRVYRRIDPVLVAPSSWMQAQAHRAPLTRRWRCQHIPNGLDLQVFRPHERADARRRLGLPASGRIILCTANSLTRQRKGKGLLTAALRELRAGGTGELTLAVVGDGRAPLPETAYRTVELGHVADERQLAIVYSAADVFVLPARADNLPNTLLESIACGTPCVASRVGGVPDIVRPTVTGWTTRAEDAADLARCLAQALSDAAALQEMGRACRRVAETEYDVTLMRERYVALYEHLLERRRSHALPHTR